MAGVACSAANFDFINTGTAAEPEAATVEDEPVQLEEPPAQFTPVIEPQVPPTPIPEDLLAQVSDERIGRAEARDDQAEIELPSP